MSARIACLNIRRLMSHGLETSMFTQLGENLSLTPQALSTFCPLSNWIRQT